MRSCWWRELHQHRITLSAFCTTKIQVNKLRQRADNSKTHCCCLKILEPLCFFIPADCISTPTSSFHKEQDSVSLLLGNRPWPISSCTKASRGARQRVQPGGFSWSRTYWSRWGFTIPEQVGVHHTIPYQSRWGFTIPEQVEVHHTRAGGEALCLGDIEDIEDIEDF